MSAAIIDHEHNNEHDHGHDHHHKETFITKYIFSIDHKMISKQYLITGIFMGIIGVGMSLLFRMQLAWPEQSFKIFNFNYLQKTQFRFKTFVRKTDFLS